MIGNTTTHERGTEVDITVPETEKMGFFQIGLKHELMDGGGVLYEISVMS